jgi:hypothetical protein
MTFNQNKSRLTRKGNKNFGADTSNVSNKCRIVHYTSSLSLNRLKTHNLDIKNGSIKENIYKKSLKRKIDYETVVVAVFKCRSLVDKIPEFHHIIISTGANVIIGSESWLT